MNTTMLKEKSIGYIKVQDYNIIKIPVVYDNKLIIYNMEILDREKIEKLVDELRDNNLSNPIILKQILTYDSYIKYIKEIISKYKIMSPQEKIKNGIVKFEAKAAELPKIYNIFRELFSFNGQKSLEKLCIYLNNLTNGITANENSPLQAEFANSTSILNAIREISEYIVLRDKEEYSIAEKVVLENYDMETVQDFMVVGKVNNNCIETGIFKVLKSKNKTMVKLDN